MLSRRKFAACVLCAAAGFAATAVGEANAQMPAGIKRTILSKTDMPDGKYVALLAEVEIDAGVAVPRHTHPGIESAYCLDGSAQLSIKGQPDRMVKQGDSFQVPTETVHSAKIQAVQARGHLHRRKGQAARHGGAGMTF